MRPMPFTRRLALRTAGAAFLSPVPSFGAQADWTPAGREAAFKICLNAGNREDAILRNFKQIGVDSVVLTGPEIPWTPESLRALMNRFQALGLSVANLMMVGFNDVIWGGKEAEAQIDRVVRSIQAAGKVGLPVVEYNFYAHRLTEGYKENPDGEGRDTPPMTTSAPRTCLRRMALASTAARTR